MKIDTRRIVSNLNTMNRNEIYTKQSKTIEKLHCLLAANEKILSDYNGSINILKEHRQLFVKNKDEQCRKAYNDYQKITRNNRFINENNYLLDTIEDENDSNTNEGCDNASIEEAVLDNYLDTTNEMIAEVPDNHLDTNIVGEQETVPDNLLNRTNEHVIDVPDNNPNTNIINEEEATNLTCDNCRRKQNLDLIENYGQCYLIEFRR